MFMLRCCTKELWKKSITNAQYVVQYVCEWECLLPSLTNLEQCRQSKASMILEGMHIVAIHVLVQVFQARFELPPCFLAKFYPFVCIYMYYRYADCYSMEPRVFKMSFLYLIQKGIHQRRTPVQFFVNIQIDVGFFAYMVWSWRSLIAK